MTAYPTVTAVEIIRGGTLGEFRCRNGPMIAVGDVQPHRSVADRNQPAKYGDDDRPDRRSHRGKVLVGGTRRRCGSSAFEELPLS
jgi:hypothetical protein